MSEIQRKTLLVTLLMVGATALSACGGGGGSSSGSTAGAADNGAVTANVGDTPGEFVAFLKALTASADDSGEPLKLPSLESVGDDTAEPAALAG